LAAPSALYQGAASQAAEKGLKVVILAVFSSFSYSQVVDSWFERMGKLLTWFLLQQPVQPCRPETPFLEFVTGTGN
jgi:hypothetical protein